MAGNPPLGIAPRFHLSGYPEAAQTSEVFATSEVLGSAHIEPGQRLLGLYCFTSFDLSGMVGLAVTPPDTAAARRRSSSRALATIGSSIGVFQPSAS